MHTRYNGYGNPFFSGSRLLTHRTEPFNLLLRHMMLTMQPYRRRPRLDSSKNKTKNEVNKYKRLGLGLDGPLISQYFHPCSSFLLVGFLILPHCLTITQVPPMTSPARITEPIPERRTEEGNVLFR